jgi:hypothetical protein
VEVGAFDEMELEPLHGRNGSEFNAADGSASRERESWEG